MEKIIKYIGLAGVHKRENLKAMLCGRYFNLVLICVVIWLLMQWHLEWTGNLSVEQAWIGDFSVWLFFLVEVLCLSLLVNNKFYYLRTNWMNLVIIFCSIPLLFMELNSYMPALRVLRLVYFFALIIPWVAISIKFLTDNRLDTTIFAVMGIIVLAGVMIVQIDPNIATIKEGVWWAWVTISTVGYGDVVPTSTMGRVLAAILILIGMGLFSVITANFAVLLIQQEKKKQWENLHKDIKEIKQQNKALQKQLERLNNIDG